MGCTIREDGGNFRGWGLEVGHWGYVFQGDISSWAPCSLSLPLSASWPPWGEQLCSTTCSPPWCSASPQAQKQWSPMTMDWNLWNYEPKYIFPPLSYFLRHFVTAINSWLTQWSNVKQFGVRSLISHLRASYPTYFFIPDQENFSTELKMLQIKYLHHMALGFGVCVCVCFNFLPHFYKGEN